MVKNSLLTDHNITLPHDFYLQLQKWILDVEQEMQSLRSMRDIVYTLEQNSGNVAFTGNPGGQADPEAFPFRVMFKNSGCHLSENSEELIVCGGQSSTGNETEAVIFAGPDKLNVFPETVISVSGTGFIYLVVNLDAESEDYLKAHIEFLSGAYIPSGKIYLVLLAQIGRSPCGFMTIRQMHYGHIYISDRIV